ncbi:MAG: hypothetical protein EOO73_27685 [Myxococcales bacterium]|nr:MAG: hypothetical protein EOO73_27685 [Myxococcales bacterium]
MKVSGRTVGVAASAAMVVGACAMLVMHSCSSSPVAKKPAGATADKNAAAAQARGDTLFSTTGSASREVAWQVGTERLYAVDFGSTLSADDDTPGSSFTLAGTATLTLAVAAVDAQGVQLAGAITAPNVVIGSEAPNEKQVQDSVLQGLLPAFVVKLQPDGRIATLSAPRETDGFAHAVLRNIVAALQFVEPPRNAGWNEWLTEESDHNGTFRARYRQVERGVFEKTKLGYSFLQMTQALQVGKAAPPPKVEATTTITRNEDGVIQRIEARERIELALAEKPFVSSSNVTLQLSAVQKRTLTQPDISRMITSELYVARSASAQMAQQRLARKRALVGDASFASLADDLAKLPRSNENRDARLDVMSRMAALFELDPRSVASASLEIRRASADDARTMLGALSDARGPDAQRALAELARDPSFDAGLRNTAMTQLGTLEEPTAETLNSLRTATGDQDPQVRAQATLALGGAVRRSDANTGPTDATQDAIGDLNRGYALAQTRDEKQLYVDALGNAGSADGLASLKRALADPDPSIRAAAVRSLRFIPGDEVDAMLAQLMTQDPDPGVRMAAIEAAPNRALSPLLMQAGQAVLKDEKLAALRAAVVAWFAASLSRAPQLIPILQAVATSDPSGDVKRVAEAALGTLVHAG